MRFSRLCEVLVIYVTLCGCVCAAGPTPIPEISSIAYVVYDADFSQVILEKNAHQQRSIASITKVMTLLYTIELVEQGIISLSDEITASARAASREGTQIRLRAGDTFTLEELLYAAALASANDAAVAIAEYVGGSEARFSELMTQRAKELGLTNTNYVDSTGLLSIFSGNYSTAYEQARLMQLALRHDLFLKIISTKEYYLPSQARTIPNTHPLLEMEGVEGGKTGATTPAGHTLTTSRVYNGRRLITVVLGARSREVRNDESEKLIAWAYDNLEVLIPKTKVITPVVVPDGVQHQINAVLERDFSLFIRNDTDRNIATKVELRQGIRAPVEQGDVVGELIVYKDRQEFARLNLVAQQGTGLSSWLRRLINQIIRFFQRIS